LASASDYLEIVLQEAWKKAFFFSFLWAWILHRIFNDFGVVLGSEIDEK